MFVAAAFSERFTTTSLTCFWTISIVTQNKTYYTTFRKAPISKNFKNMSVILCALHHCQEKNMVPHIYSLLHPYSRGKLEHSLNAVHHFVFTTHEKFKWTETQNQISNAKQLDNISLPPLFFDFGVLLYTCMWW
jgi:uncharacterized protein YpbB